jgi:hypothetical protein
MPRKKKLYDVVFLSHTCGLNHERVELTQAQADSPEKAIKAAFGETLKTGMGDDYLIKPVE